MDAALIIMWNVPMPGREKQALDLGAEAGAYWGKLAEEGKCTSPEWFFLPDGTGMWMVKGDRRTLEELTAESGSRRLLQRGALLLQGWRYTIAVAGTGAEEYMAEYATAGQGLGIL